MKKYLANSPLSKIEQVDILRETDASVYVASKYAPTTGNRCDKISESRGYFDAFDQARRFLLEIEEQKIATLTRELARRQANVGRILEMTE